MVLKVTSNVLFGSLFSLIFVVHSKEVEVTLRHGTIRGFIDNNQVNVFLGIPFALPPIGDLRFRKPQPITTKWNTSLDATKWPNVCMQETMFFEFLSETSEDCLYLNVWSSVDFDADFSTNLRPVVVFIHGGGFMFGGSSYKPYDGSILSAFGDVVVVTVNYRLGAFGFLSAGTKDAPGNVGLYDQALALEWIQENIAYFGGDPKIVTLSGESAGAWSVSLHFLSPISQSSFRRAIFMSGATFQGVSVETKDEAVRKTLELSRLLGCDVKKREIQVTTAHMECLRSADATKIVQMQSSHQLSSFSWKSLTKINFVPIVGETFIPKEPREMLEQRSFNEKVDVLVGTLPNEGFIVHFLMEYYKTLPPADDYKEALRYFINFSFKGLSSDQIFEILDFYFGGINDDKNNEAKMAYYTALGDVFFTCETNYFSETVSKTNNLYQYFLDYALVNKKDNLDPCDLEKACHGNELPLTFGSVSDEEDIEVSKKWIDVLISFIKNGTVEWPKRDKKSAAVYKFTGDEWDDKILHRFRHDACELWKPIFYRHYLTLIVQYP